MDTKLYVIKNNKGQYWNFTHKKYYGLRRNSAFSSRFLQSYSKLAEEKDGKVYQLALTTEQEYDKTGDTYSNTKNYRQVYNGKVLDRALYVVTSSTTDDYWSFREKVYKGELTRDSTISQYNIAKEVSKANHGIIGVLYDDDILMTELEIKAAAKTNYGNSHHENSPHKMNTTLYTIKSTDNKYWNNARKSYSHLSANTVYAYPKTKIPENHSYRVVKIVELPMTYESDLKQLGLSYLYAAVNEEGKYYNRSYKKWGHITAACLFTTAKGLAPNRLYCDEEVTALLMSHAKLAADDTISEITDSMKSEFVPTDESVNKSANIVDNKVSVTSHQAEQLDRVTSIISDLLGHISEGKRYMLADVPEVKSWSDKFLKAMAKGWKVENYFYVEVPFTNGRMIYYKAGNNKLLATDNKSGDQSQLFTNDEIKQYSLEKCKTELFK